MSYCRFGASDLYVFLHSDGHLTCCACKLLSEPDTWGKDFDASKTRDMVAHVEEHIKAGHSVPGELISDLNADQKENDAWIRRRRRIGVRPSPRPGGGGE